MLIPATAFHAAALAAIHADAFPAPERWGADAMELQLGQPGGFGFLDPAGGLVLGRTAADEAEILTLAVAQACRRRGIGRALLSAAMREAGVRGAAEMFLEVKAGNAVALALYTGAGFVPVGRRPAYYPGGGDALVLRAAMSCGSAGG